MQVEWMGGIAVALSLLVGCQKTIPEGTPAPSNVVEHESDDAIQRYMQAQDQNSRQMAEQFQEQTLADPALAEPPLIGQPTNGPHSADPGTAPTSADAGLHAPPPAAPQVTVDII
ncbi:hypothetical protein [Rhodopirellula sp. P2]|uniref:hypothetical protein n=1 Tax=Rhodopirellula sp. P2 TaxID=2127060 RepID=UPI002367F053|nr:hypothetical protein [Rhodopirellula sp. P2]WDQ16640.1 hypothetical protein PSR62_23930 [Rhodopirellula sp. P2]